LVHPSKKLPGSALIIREMVLTRQIYTKIRKYTMFYRGFPMESIKPGDSGLDRTSRGIRGRFRYTAKPRKIFGTLIGRWLHEEKNLPLKIDS
jgi:hypothetical protein